MTFKISTPLTITELLIKTTMRCDPTPVRMATVDKRVKWQSVHKDEQALERLVHPWQECELLQPPWKVTLTVKTRITVGSTNLRF
jgi:hypothetical protein